MLSQAIVTGKAWSSPNSRKHRDTIEAVYGSKSKLGQLRDVEQGLGRHGFDRYFVTYGRYLNVSCQVNYETNDLAADLRSERHRLCVYCAGSGSDGGSSISTSWKNRLLA